MTLATCGRCEGEGALPPDFMTACPVCRGRGKVPGRPDDWPPIGAVLEEVDAEALFGDPERLELVDGPIVAGLIPAKRPSGDRVNLPPGDVGSRYRVIEIPTEEDPQS